MPLIRFACLTVSLLGSMLLYAQDPFNGGGNGLFDEKKKDAAIDVSDDPVAAQLMELSRRGNLQMADSIAALARTGRWSLVERLLATLAEKDLSTADAASIARRIGPDNFLKIRQHEGISKASIEALDLLGKAAIADSQLAPSLQKAIAGLGDDSEDNRLQAARTLLRGGNASVRELVAAAVAVKKSAKLDDILRVLHRFEPAGTEALGQLALYGKPNVRAAAIAALYRMDPETHMNEYVTAIHDASSSKDERTIASEALSKWMPSMPTRGQAISILHNDLETKRTAAARIENDDQRKTLWLVNDQGTGVRYQTTRRIIAAYRDVADAAYRLRRIRVGNSEVLKDVLAGDLAYRVMIDPDWGDAEQIEIVLESYQGFLDEQGLLETLRQSLDQQDVPATIGLLRLVGQRTDVWNPVTLLSSDGGRPTSLVSAASSGEPRVRYEAATAVATLANGSPYADSSQVQRTLREMAALGDRPVAILVETRPEIVLTLEQFLTDLGYRVEVVGSVSVLWQRVSAGGDIRLVLSKTRLWDFPAIELLDTVRRMRRGATVPIVFYGTDEVDLGQQRWTAPVMQIDQPASTAAFDRVLNEVELGSRMGPLSVTDRQVFRHAASQLLIP